MAHRKLRSSRHKTSFSLTSTQQLAIIAALVVVVIVGVFAGGISQLGGPAGQQFAPAVNAPDGCGDTDGIDYYVQGRVVNILAGAQKDFSDYCASSETVAEYYCSGKIVDVVLVDCPNGCSGGRCNR